MSCGRPPAQIPACGITALGSYLGCVAAKRASGKGCITRTGGSHRLRNSLSRHALQPALIASPRLPKCGSLCVTSALTFERPTLPYAKDGGSLRDVHHSIRLSLTGPDNPGAEQHTLQNNAS